MPTTRVFMNGNSQAVRIPQQFRLPLGPVDVRKNDAGELVIRPLRNDRGQALLDVLHEIDEAFADDVEWARRDQPGVQEREPL
jgi:antitoxin VapB